MPADFTMDEIGAHAEASIAHHFESSPQQLSVTFIDSGETASI
jgi:hypothetical protein